MKKTLLAMIVAAAGIALAAEPTLKAKIAERHKVLGTDDWYGGRRTVFNFDGYEAWVVEPPEGVPVAEGHPWTWTMQWATAYVPRTAVPRLLKRGWRHVTIITFKDKMNETGLKASAKFQKYLVDELGFAPKANLIGMSWGGFFSTRYAVRYPENVATAYLDAPLLTFADFDPAKEKSNGRYGPWCQSAPKDGKWSNDPRMPVNLAADLAKTGIPIYLVYGGQDKSCPMETNAKPFIRRFKEAGGENNLKVLYREYFGHHPHGMEESSNAIIDFFEAGRKASERGNAGNAADSTDEAIDRIKATVPGGDITEIRRYRSGDAEPAWMKGAGDATIVHFTLKPTQESEIHCRLLLPSPEKWDGRFWGVGNQGLGSDIRDWLFREWQLPRLKAGSASCIADMGTANGRFGREVVRDFGWRAAHAMTVEAKRMIETFYGRAAKKNYFIGLSSGGGQGIHEALRFPEDYDGIVAYVPANYRTAHARMSRHNYRMMHDESGKAVVTPEQCKAVVDAAISHFAARQGVLGGKCVAEIGYSKADADAILDLAAAKMPEFANADLRRRWHGIWEGPEIDGKHPSGCLFGADITSLVSRKSFLPEILYGMSAKQISAMSDDEFEGFIAAIRDDVDATDPNLDKFVQRGKLIAIAGSADPLVSARTVRDYCERLDGRYGADGMKKFFRAYFLPGRDHGWRPKGRDGVGNVDAAGAIIRWCEKGEAPEALPGSIGDGSQVMVKPWSKD